MFILRVITGTLKGQKLKTVKGTNTRPTSDKVKGGLFNILSADIPGARVLDLFAGTGNLGIEALSRGAASVRFIDKSAESISIIKENLKATKQESKAVVMPGDVLINLKKISGDVEKYDIIFMDPPYNKNFIEETLNIIAKNGIIRDNGIIVVERSIKDDVSFKIDGLKHIRDQRYGDTVLTFYLKIFE